MLICNHFSALFTALCWLFHVVCYCWLMHANRLSHYHWRGCSRLLSRLKPLQLLWLLNLLLLLLHVLMWWNYFGYQEDFFHTKPLQYRRRMSVINRDLKVHSTLIWHMTTFKHSDNRGKILIINMLPKSLRWTSSNPNPTRDWLQQIKFKTIPSYTRSTRASYWLLKLKGFTDKIFNREQGALIEEMNEQALQINPRPNNRRPMDNWKSVDILKTLMENRWKLHVPLSHNQM